MNKQKWILIGVVSGLFISFAVAASSSPLNTPLYIFRMEQASSEMSFLPTEVNQFTYITEKGYTLDCSVTGSDNVSPLNTGVWSCEGSTCQPWHTCWCTCPYTCLNTCGATCTYWTCPMATCFTCIHMS